MNAKTASWLLLLIIIITVVLYLPTFDWPVKKGILNEFSYPLSFSLVENTFAFICQIENPYSMGFVRPMSHLFLYIDFLISGYNPFGVRLTHLLLHIGNLLAVYALARLLLRKSGWAVLAAALFAFHPNAREAVISTLPQDLLATLGFLWGIWFWGKYLLESPKRPQWLLLTLVALSFGILSKELLLVFPILAFALQIAFRMEGRIEKLELNKLWWTYALQFAVLGGYWIYRLSVLGGVGGYMGAGHFSFNSEMIRNAVRVVNGAFFIESSVEAAQFNNVGWLLGTSLGGIVTLLGLRPRKMGSIGWATAFAFVFMFLSAAPPSRRRTSAISTMAGR